MTTGRVKEKLFPHTCESTSSRSQETTQRQPSQDEVIELSDESSDNEIASGTPPAIQDMTQQMAEETDTLALQEMSAPPSRIWELIREEFTGGILMRGLSQEQVISRVYRTRSRHFGGFIYGQVEVPPLSLARDGTNFFQFNFTYATQDGPQRVLGWGHPMLIRLLTYANVSMFTNGTFRSAPASFYQCAVVMVYDRGSRCYVPCIAMLSTCKTEWSWWHCLHCVQVTTGMNMQPGNITCDFERALLNAVGDQFPDSTTIDCLFHFKQAVRRRMQKICTPSSEILTAVGQGMLDLLTVLLHDQIDPQGIDHVTGLIKASLVQREIEYSEAKWATFWTYFRRTWIEVIPPRVWNVRGINQQLVNRTNNPLERYNRELNGSFPNARPNLPTFVGVLERHAHHYVTLLEDIARGQAHPPAHGAYFVPREFTL